MTVRGVVWLLLFFGAAIGEQTWDFFLIIYYYFFNVYLCAVLLVFVGIQQLKLRVFWFCYYLLFIFKEDNNLVLQ